MHPNRASIEGNGFTVSIRPRLMAPPAPAAPNEEAKVNEEEKLMDEICLEDEQRRQSNAVSAGASRVQ